METSYLKTLELDKIIARAAEGCVCQEAKAQMLALEPQCDPDEVRYALEQTDAINGLLIKNGSPRFGGVEGVSQLVTRAVKGGVGIAMLPDYMADHRSGLVPVLPELEGPSFDTFFVYPDAMKNQAKLKVFRDFMFAQARNWAY